MKILYELMQLGEIPVYTSVGGRRADSPGVSTWDPGRRSWTRAKGMRLRVPLQACTFRRFAEVLKRRADKLERRRGRLHVMLHTLEPELDAVVFGLVHLTAGSGETRGRIPKGLPAKV